MAKINRISVAPMAVTAGVVAAKKLTRALAQSSQSNRATPTLTRTKNRLGRDRNGCSGCEAQRKIALGTISQQNGNVKRDSLMSRSCSMPFEVVSEKDAAITVVRAGTPKYEICDALQLQLLRVVAARCVNLRERVRVSPHVRVYSVEAVDQLPFLVCCGQLRPMGTVAEETDKSIGRSRNVTRL